MQVKLNSIASTRGPQRSALRVCAVKVGEKAPAFKLKDQVRGEGRGMRGDHIHMQDPSRNRMARKWHCPSFRGFWGPNL